MSILAHFGHLVDLRVLLKRKRWIWVRAWTRPTRRRKHSKRRTSLPCKCSRAPTLTRPTAPIWKTFFRICSTRMRPRTRRWRPLLLQARTTRRRQVFLLFQNCNCPITISNYILLFQRPLNQIQTITRLQSQMLKLIIENLYIIYSFRNIVYLSRPVIYFFASIFKLIRWYLKIIQIKETFNLRVLVGFTYFQIS